MLPAMIKGATRTLGKSQGYKGLPVRDDRLHIEDGGVVHTITTAWEPTPDEAAAIAAGAKIEVTILAQEHPPISIVVGALPEGE